MSKYELKIGEKFNRLTIVSETTVNPRNRTVLCKCDCGNVCQNKLFNVIHGIVKSCGCYHKEEMRKRANHGGYLTRLYNTWINIKQRCSSERHLNYEGRGISICAEWKNSFESFRDWSVNNGYSETLTIDRIDNNGNYEPSNCQWITNIQQQSNKRTNRFLTYNGRRQTLTQWANEAGFNVKSFEKRVNVWGIKDAIETPKIPCGHSRKSYLLKTAL